MKRNFSLLLFTCCALPGLVGAQNAAPAGAMTLTPPGAPLDKLNYEQARQMFRIREQTTPAQARANVAALAGTVIEMQGDVLGMMATTKGRVFMLKVAGGLISFNVAPTFQNFDPLKSGGKARILAEVGDDAGFTIVAATSQLLDLSAPPVAAPATVEVAPQKVAAPGSDVVIVPPMVTMIAPAGGSTGASAPVPQMFTPGTVIKGDSDPRLVTRGAPPTAAVRDTTPGAAYSDKIAAQKPAYKAIVLRYNKRLPDAQVDEIAAALLGAGYQYKIDPRFLAAVIAVESDFDIYCRSGSGAMGLGQLMPFNVTDLGISDPWNPTQNINGTARLLRGHLDEFGRFGARGPLLAVAAYNAGPGAVKRAGYNVPAGEQVQRYVWKVYYAYKSLAPDMFK